MQDTARLDPHNFRLMIGQFVADRERDLGQFPSAYIVSPCMSSALNIGSAYPQEPFIASGDV